MQTTKERPDRAVETVDAETRLRTTLEAHVAQERTAVGGADTIGATPRHPEVSAALVALITEHGLRRIPEREELLWAHRRAQARQVRYRAGNALTRAWLRATDPAFVRNATRHLVGPVLGAVNSTSHDPHEVRLVNELAATFATYQLGQTEKRRVQDATAPAEEARTERAIPTQPTRAPAKPRVRTRITHRVTVTREQAGLPRLRRGQRERDHAGSA